MATMTRLPASLRAALSDFLDDAGAIAEDELADWFVLSTSLVPSGRDADGRITDWAQESPVPRSKHSLPLGLAIVSYTHSYGSGCSG